MYFEAMGQFFPRIPVYNVVQIVTISTYTEMYLVIDTNVLFDAMNNMIQVSRILLTLMDDCSL